MFLWTINGPRDPRLKNTALLDVPDYKINPIIYKEISNVCANLLIKFQFLKQAELVQPRTPNIRRPWTKLCTFFLSQVISIAKSFRRHLLSSAISDDHRAIINNNNETFIFITTLSPDKGIKKKNNNNKKLFPRTKRLTRWHQCYSPHARGFLGRWDKKKRKVKR